MSEIAWFGARELAAAIRARRLGAVEVVSVAVDRIFASQPTVNAFSEVLAEDALREAARIDGRSAHATELPLLGVPLAVKDNIETVDGHTTHGSRCLAGHRAGRDAAIVSQLRRAGCIVIGKTTMPELALRATTESAAYGVTRNPADLARTPGGSSGGSGAAVAAGLVPLALGNDAGGSIRIPAAWCGTIGVKPSRGSVSWGPGRAESWLGLGTNGVMARDIRDAKAALEVISGPERANRSAAGAPAQATKATQPLRVAVTVEGHLGAVSHEARAATESAADALSQLGHHVEHACPRLDGLLDSFLVIGPVSTVAEAPEIDWDRAEPYTREVAHRAHGITSVDLARALEKLRRRTAEIIAFWDRYDVLLTPTMSIPAPLIEERPDDPDRWQDYLGWAQFLFPFNVTGQPALSLPWRVPGCNLPLGVQLVGPAGGDELVVEVGATLAELSEWRPSEAAAP